MNITYLTIPKGQASSKKTATIHKSGKLGFNKGAMGLMNLKKGDHYQIGMNHEDDNDRALYLGYTTKPTEKTLKVAAAGDYYYLNTGPLFDELNYNYKEKKIMYDITTVDNRGFTLYKLKPRVLDRKSSE